MSSPSLPLSVAQIKLSTSLLFINFFNIFNWGAVFFIIFNFICSGNIGNVSFFHFLYLSSYSSGSANVTKCPIAQQTIYFCPYKNPSPFCLHCKTRAISLATEGFSAITNILPILFSSLPFVNAIISLCCFLCK